MYLSLALRQAAPYPLVPGRGVYPWVGHLPGPPSSTTPHPPTEQRCGLLLAMGYWGVGYFCHGLLRFVLPVLDAFAG